MGIGGMFSHQLLDVFPPRELQGFVFGDAIIQSKYARSFFFILRGWLLSEVCQDILFGTDGGDTSSEAPSEALKRGRRDYCVRFFRGLTAVSILPDAAPTTSLRLWRGGKALVNIHWIKLLKLCKPAESDLFGRVRGRKMFVKSYGAFRLCNQKNGFFNIKKNILNRQFLEKKFAVKLH